MLCGGRAFGERHTRLARCPVSTRFLRDRIRRARMARVSNIGCRRPSDEPAVAPEHERAS